MGNRLAGIVFDLDGVLVDSEPLHERAWRQTLAPHGIEFSSSEYAASLMGLDDQQLMRAAYALLRRPFPEERAERFLDDKAAALHAIVADGVTPMPGAAELVRAAAARFRIGLCTGSRAREVEWLLDGLGVLEAFSVVVTADDVERSKPDPTGYRRAAAALGHEAATLLAIEDTPTGVRAARAAGLRVLGVSAADPGRLAEAHHVERSLAGVDLEDLACWMDGSKEFA